MTDVAASSSAEEVRAKRKENYIEHKDEILARNRAYKISHPEKRKRWAVQWKNKVKLEVIAHYSDKTMACADCGFDDIRALTIDHINGGGSQHRKRINGYHIPAWLRKNGYPEGYQVLCMNCQFIKKAEGKEYGKYAQENEEVLV